MAGPENGTTANGTAHGKDEIPSRHVARATVVPGVWTGCFRPGQARFVSWKIASTNLAVWPGRNIFTSFWKNLIEGIEAWQLASEATAAGETCRG
jgi:hypothetical protein